MRKTLPWLLGAALAVTAGTITAITPSDDALYAAISVPGHFDPDAEDQQPVTTRSVTATVIDATFAERIEDGDWHADGTWLVVTVAASATRSEFDAELGLAKLQIGDEVFQASERPRSGFLDTGLRLGIDTTGMLAFELPGDARRGTAQLRLSSSFLTPHLDDVATLTLPLDELPTARSIEIRPPEPAW